LNKQRLQNPKQRLAAERNWKRRTVLGALGIIETLFYYAAATRAIDARELAQWLERHRKLRTELLDMIDRAWTKAKEKL